MSTFKRVSTTKVSTTKVLTKKVPATLAILIGLSFLSVSSLSQANNAGAFIGGVFATKLIQNGSRRAQAEEQQAYAAQQRPVHSAPAKKSPEQRIKELDKLAAGGYITPEEYKKKKQSIIDSM